MTATAGVVGWPVSHSLSPVLHRYWLKEYEIDGIFVDPIPVEPGKLKEAVEALRERKFRGINVTVPLKEEAFKLANKPLAAATDAGAANLLVFTKDGDIGANNTDGAGLVDSLEKALGIPKLAGKNIVLLGAGGAARGAILALKGRNVAKITVLNRDARRAEQLVAHAKSPHMNTAIEAGSLFDWNRAAEDAWLVINTTSAGMKGNPPLELDLSALPKATNVCDIVYNPLETPLLKQAKRLGHNPIDGLGMLMHQAVPSFQAFFYDEMGGKMPEVTKGLRDTLVKELMARG